MHPDGPVCVYVCMPAPRFLPRLSSAIAPQLRSRKAHKLRIPRPAIPADAPPLQDALHVYPARLVEADRSAEPAAAHDVDDLALGVVVEARARVAAARVGQQVERRRGEAGLDVRGEGGRDGAGARVEVREEGEPGRAGEVGGWGGRLVGRRGGEGGAYRWRGRG